MYLFNIILTKQKNEVTRTGSSVRYQPEKVTTGATKTQSLTGFQTHNYVQWNAKQAGGATADTLR